ncbi:MAG: WYL domain-containing protein [Bacillota bacterium]
MIDVIHRALSAGKTLRIIYIDEDGQISDRRIRVSSLRTKKDGKEIVMAHDLALGAIRSFHIDRILAAEID